MSWAFAALRDGDIDRALTLLKRAAAVDGSQAVTHLHLGRAHAAAFELEAAAAAYARRSPASRNCTPRACISRSCTRSAVTPCARS